MSRIAAEFDPAATIECLLGVHVPFVLVGTLAGQVHGSPALARSVEVVISVAGRPSSVPPGIELVEPRHVDLRFDRLMTRASMVAFGPDRIAVATLDDLIALRRETGSLRDLIELEILGALREELDEEG